MTFNELVEIKLQRISNKIGFTKNGINDIITCTFDSSIFDSYMTSSDTDLNEIAFASLDTNLVELCMEYNDLTDALEYPERHI